MKESDVQKKIIDFFHSIGAYTIKVIKANKAGVTDIVACVPIKITQDMVGKTIGVFVGAEVKRDEEARRISDKKQPLQNRNIKQIKRAGGLAAKVISVEEVEDMLEI